MSFNNCEKDSAYIKSNLVETKDNKLITKRNCSIYVPTRYEKKQLLFIRDRPLIAGMYGITMDNKFAFNNVPTMMEISPSEVVEVVIDGISYYRFDFLAGDVVLPTTYVIVDRNIPYKFYDEFIVSGRVPGYITYEDLSKILDNAPKYAGIKFPKIDPCILGCTVATIYRDPSNVKKYYRQSILSKEWMNKNPPKIVAYKDIKLTASNTSSKLGGSYLDDGLNAALVDTSETMEPIETLLRK